MAPARVDLSTGRGSGGFGADTLAGFEAALTGAGNDNRLGGDGHDWLDDSTDLASKLALFNSPSRPR
jgi:hypothetical protein